MRTTTGLSVRVLLVAAIAALAAPHAVAAQIIRGPYGFYPPYGAYAAPTGDVRLQVSPERTEVYVDGYYAGIADDFDGVFQRLRVLPGPHVIELYLDGHRSHRETAYLAQGSTHKIRHTMMPLAAGDKSEARPVPTTPPPDQDSPRPPDRGNPFPGARGRGRPIPPSAGQPARGGAVAIRVQPPNADVMVDGQRWPGPDGADPLTIQLSEGRHRIEVEKEGFQRFATEIDISRGETTALNVSLTKS
jgi:hypothetical protein